MELHWLKNKVDVLCEDNQILYDNIEELKLIIEKLIH